MTEVARRKSNGFGHTYRVGNSWKTVIRYQGRVITANSPIKAESRRRAREKYEIAISGGKKVLPANKKISVATYFINWLDNEHRESIAPTTYRRYSSLMNTHIVPVIGKIQLTTLTRNDLSKVLTKMSANGQSTRSQQQARAVLMLVCREAFESGVLNQNPSLGLRSIKVQTSSAVPLTIVEVKRLLATFIGTELGARLHIALVCGLRQGEALGLRWSDIDLTQRTLNVRQQLIVLGGQTFFAPLKTSRSQRTIILTEETIRALEVHREKQEGRPLLVFPRKNGEPLSPHTDYANWKRALQLCGIAPKRLHDARHTAATLMYSQGIGIEVISRALGHSTSAITSKLYVHSAEEPIRKAAEVINQLLK